MRSCLSWRAVALAIAVLISTARTGSAQNAPATPGANAQDVRSPVPTEGHGIRLGDFELHPGIGAEIGWTDNVFLEAPSEHPDKSAVLRVSPHIHLSTLTTERLTENLGQDEQQKVSFRFGATGTLKQYFATELKDHPNMGVGQDARLTLRPGRVFQLEIFDDFHRTIDPFTQALAPAPSGGTMPTSADYDRDQLGVGTRIQLSTPGALFRVGVGYRFDLDYFEGSNFKDNNNVSHTISSDTSWEFLPKTALFWNGSVRLFDYTASNTVQDASIVSRSDSTNVQSKIGINGALTARLGFTIAGGYGAGFLDNNNDYENFIAQVEARWRFTETAMWALGYDREYNPSFQGDFARIDRIKTRLQSLLGSAVILTLRAELSWIDYGEDPKLMQARNDLHLLTDLMLEYRIVSWFAITGEVGYIQNFTDFVYMVNTNGNNFMDPAKYHQFQAFFGVRAFL